MMGLFKKPNRKFRQRVTHSDSDDENTQGESLDNKDQTPKDPKNITTSENRIEKTASASSARDVSSKEESQLSIPATKLLSFHDEEDETEVFKLKKSSYSRRLTRQLEKEKKKRNEIAAAASATKCSSSEHSKEQDTKSGKESWNVLTGKEAEDMDVEDENDDNKETESKKENPFKDVLQSGVIPDAATIYAMKKHRQMAREMGDFIPLEEPEQEDENKSRLVREDDNDRSDDDEDDEPSRINFTVNTGAVERQKVREAFLSLQEAPNNELENEDAAELDRWEQEQIRKGVSLLAQQTNVSQTQASDSTSTYYPYVSTVMTEDSYYSQQPTSISHQLDLNESNKTDLTTTDIKLRLEERLSALRKLNETHQQELESVDKEVEEARSLVEKLEKEAPRHSSQFSLYQQMRGYVRDLVECLDLKVAHVEILDTRMLELYKTKAKALIQRRQLDVRDQAEEYSLLSSKILKGSGAEITGDRNGSVDETKLRRTAEREGRRMRRRKQREYTSLLTKHQDGMSSDDEEPDIEVIKFRDAKESILLGSKEVFEDVVDDFGSIHGVVASFEKWRNEQQESYVEAFVPLCLPKIFAPFVRIEMLNWNPLQDGLNIESTTWYKCLTYYGCHELNDDDDVEDDPDVNLLPSIVDKILIPRVTAFIKDVWDPISTHQTTNLVDIARKVQTEYLTISGKSKTIQTMLQAVITRINKALDDDIYIPLYPKELLENRSSGSYAFFQRQFWSAVKILKNILSWNEIIAEKPLQDLSLSLLLNRYLLMGLNTSMMMKDTFDKCKAIFTSFPKSWFSGAKGSSCLPQLKPFSLFLVKYAQSFHSQLEKRITPEMEEEIRDTLKEIVQILITLNALDEAVILAKEFSISGFKKDK